jgi:hypothetical protein
VTVAQSRSLLDSDSELRRGRVRLLLLVSIGVAVASMGPARVEPEYGALWVLLSLPGRAVPQSELPSP